MFEINDYVIYNSNGVYKVVDICTENNINEIATEYYVLEPAFGANLTIKTPVNNRKVLMRGVLDKEHLLGLLNNMAGTETFWIDDARQRSDSFRTALRSGDSREWVKLLKTLYLEQIEKAEAGKKLMKIDEEIMRAAEKNLNEEIAIALKISPDEVPDLIRSQYLHS